MKEHLNGHRGEVRAHTGSKIYSQRCKICDIFVVQKLLSKSFLKLLSWLLGMLSAIMNSRLFSLGPNFRLIRHPNFFHK